MGELRDSNRAPTWLSTKSVTPPTRGMDTLSMITTEQELTQLNGWRIGMRQLLMNCSNFSPFTVPSILQTPLIPSSETTGIAEQRVPRTKSLYGLKMSFPSCYMLISSNSVFCHTHSHLSIPAGIEGSYTATSAMNFALRPITALHSNIDYNILNDLTCAVHEFQCSAYGCNTDKQIPIFSKIILSSTSCSNFPTSLGGP